MALSFSVDIGGAELHFEHPAKGVEVFDFVSSNNDSAVIEIIDDRFQHVEVDVVEDERAFIALITLNLPGEIRRSSCEQPGNILDFVSELYRERLRRWDLFLHEHPAAATSGMGGGASWTSWRRIP